MTDAQAVLAILLVLLSIAAGLTLHTLTHSVRNWRRVQRDHLNGARQVIATAYVRRPVERLLIILAMMVVYGARLITGHVMPGLSLIIGFAIVGVLINQAVWAVLENRWLYWFLRGDL